MRSAFRLIALLMLASCVSGNIPQMDQKVKVWNGAPEEVGICRMSSANLAVEINAVEQLVRSYHQGTTAYECIQANDEAFKSYACLTFQDLGVLNAYIEKLIYSCKKWE